MPILKKQGLFIEWLAINICKIIELTILLVAKINIKVRLSIFDSAS